MFFIKKKVPYLIIGGKELKGTKLPVSEAEFWNKMKEELENPDEIEEKKPAIIEHLSKGADNFIEIGDYYFTFY